MTATGPVDPSDAADPGEPLDDDERWLRAREDGTALPPLSPERAASYEALAELVREREPIGAPPSVRDELRVALDQEEARRRRQVRLRRAAAVASAAVAVAAIAIWLGTRRTTMAAFDIAITPDGVTRAGSASGSAAPGEQHFNAAVGERLVVEVRHPELKELRLYRDRELAARCPGDAGCTGGGTRWRLATRLDPAGRYRVVRVSKVSVDPAGDHDADVAALRSAGAELDDRIIDVR